MDELEDRLAPALLGQQVFPSDYPWNQNIANAPVAANSAAIITHIGSSIKLHPDWGQDSPSNGTSPLYGIPYNVVHGNSSTVTKVNVIIDNYPGESNIVPVPIPSGAVIEGDYQNGPNPNGGGYNAGQRGDSHLIVWDEDNNVAYELYGVTRPSDPNLFPDTSGVELQHTDGQWHAAQESVWNMKADGFRPLGNTSADAAGLSILAGLVRPDEGLPTAQGGQGAINHALRFTLPSGDVNPQYIYPASHVVSTSAGTTKLPFGARLRLMNTPTVNALISTMGPEAQIIAHAMQQYGLVLADIGSAMYVTGTSASQDANNNISLTWNMTDVLGLRTLTAGDFEVVDLTPRVTGLSTSSGTEGSTITVIGQNFSGAAGHLSVYFGSTAATSVTYVDDAHLTVVVPSGSGTVDVTVQSGSHEIDPNNPSDNVNNPIFGYGVSAKVAADQFTYGTSPTQLVLTAPATATAGTGFIVTVNAEDAGGHLASTFTGTVSLSSSAGGDATPTSLTLTNGTGVALVSLTTAGSQTITAAYPGLISGLAAMMVNAGSAVKLRFAVQPVSTPTGLTLPPLSVQILDLYGNVVTSDNSNAVVLGIASGPGPFTASSKTTATAVNGVASFDSVTLVVPGPYTLSVVVPGRYTGPVPNAFTVVPLQVVPGSFAGTPSGFSLEFNAPFLVNSATPVLYGKTLTTTAPVPSVTLTQTQDSGGNPVHHQIAGSLVLDTANNRLTFVATNTTLETNYGSPLLADGTYSVVVHGTAAGDGFQALNSGGGFLDGLNGGTPGSGDYTATFTVSAAAAHDDVLWLPATADGPGQALSAPGKNQVGGGYPVYLSDSTGMVSSVQATLMYNPALLTVTPTSTSDFTVTVPSPGTAVLHYNGPLLPVGSQTPVGFISAMVPAGTTSNPTPYRATDFLQLSGVSLNGGAVPVVTSDGLHLVAYVGDADGNGTYSSNDAVLITRVVLQTDSGFAAYPLVDPVIVADTDGAGFIPADAALQVNEAGVGVPTANLANPPIPAGVVFHSLAQHAEPALEITSKSQMVPGTTVTIAWGLDTCASLEQAICAWGLWPAKRWPHVPSSR